MANAALIDAYQEFMSTAQRFVHIDSEEDYQGALETLEIVLESASDTLDDPWNPLIDMLSHAIEVYESRDDELMAFIADADDGEPIDILLIRALMKNHKLTGSDLPEIGNKTLVSKVLNGRRNLTRSAIERLSVRFGLRPSMFFGECH